MKKKTALIISLNFNPGHVSHMVAFGKQFEELGYESVFYADRKFKDFMPKGSSFVTSEEPLPQSAIAIITFPSLKNLKTIWRLKRKGTKNIYIFHEPIEPLYTYRATGFSYLYVLKVILIHYLNALTVKLSDYVFLPSQKAMNLYEKHDKIYRNRHAYYMPLMFPDERTDDYNQIERKYFSYIGTVAMDHSFNEYVSFVEKAISHDLLPQLQFLIATKSEFEVPGTLKNSDRVKIQKGRPLTDEEINSYYAQTYVIWNAYYRTTQSGVLAKAFMFGTPAIILSKNENEFTSNGVEVVTIDDNQSSQQIEQAATEILNNFYRYSNACRSRFLTTFYYRNYNENLKEILST